LWRLRLPWLWLPWLWLPRLSLRWLLGLRLLLCVVGHLSLLLKLAAVSDCIFTDREFCWPGSIIDPANFCSIKP
jgi:hypothetical protein